MSMKTTDKIIRDHCIGQLNQDNMIKLRRRIEDLLRKSPATVLQVGSILAEEGRIRIDDLTN